MNTAVTSLPPGSASQATASALAGLRRGLRRAGNGLWAALEAAGHARAQRHLLAFADQCEAQQPELAKELRAAAHKGPMA
jgi:predicted DNA-binding transcriptional regulator YafY